MLPLLLPAFLLPWVVRASQVKLFERNKNFTTSTLQSALIPNQVGNFECPEQNVVIVFF
jgi:hypothetical protein